MGKAFIGNFKGPTGPPGPKGDPGEIAAMPSIGSNGNWFIGDRDTGILADIEKAVEKRAANNLTTTEEGYLLDARQGKILKDDIDSLNSNMAVKQFERSATVSYNGNNSMSVKCYREGSTVTTHINYSGSLPKGIIGISPAGVSGITIPEGYRPSDTVYVSYVGVAGASVYAADVGRYRIHTDGTIYHGCTEESFHERNVTVTYHTNDDMPA